MIPLSTVPMEFPFAEPSVEFLGLVNRLFGPILNNYTHRERMETVR